MNDFKKVSTLQERDLELRKQLNDINNASVKKLLKKVPELPVVQTKTKKLMTGTPQAIGDLALRDLAFQVQLDDIAEKAVGGKDIVPSKINREITPEMVDDFENAERVPVEIEGKLFKYNPSSLDLTLEPLDLPFEKSKYSSVDEINTIREYERTGLENEYERFNKMVPVLEKERAAMKIKFNVTVSKLRTARAATIDPNEITNIDAEISKLTAQYSDDNMKNGKKLFSIQRNLENIDRGLKGGLDRHFDNLIREFVENETEQERIDTTNKSKIAAYIQDIQALNSDLNISRNIGESDAEFAKRLEGLSQQTISPGEEEEAIKRKIFLRMKANLRKLMSDTAKAEATTKLLTAEEQYEYNKREPVINKKFLEVYGFNNKRVSESDIADFIKNMINENAVGLVSSLKAPATAKKIAPATPTRGPPPSPIPFAAAIPITEPAGVRLRKHIENLGVTIPDRLPIHEVLKEYDENNIEIPDDIIADLGKKADKIFAEKINLRIRAAPRGVGTGPPMSPPEPPMSGVGVKEYPKLVKFGKIYISADELYYKNILKVRNGKKHAVVGIPNLKVSDELAAIFLKIIDGEKVSKSHLNLLSNKERQVYDQICIMSGLHKTHDNTFDTTAQELKKQLEVVEGEIMAGNNNPELLKEVHRLLWTMNSVGLLSGKVALEHFKDLKRIYF